jgi:hypothetical protein
MSLKSGSKLNLMVQIVPILILMSDVIVQNFTSLKFSIFSRMTAAIVFLTVLFLRRSIKDPNRNGLGLVYLTSACVVASLSTVINFFLFQEGLERSRYLLDFVLAIALVHGVVGLAGLLQIFPRLLFFGLQVFFWASITFHGLAIAGIFRIDKNAESISILFARGSLSQDGYFAGTLGNPNDYSFSILIVMLISLSYLNYTKKIFKWKWFFYIHLLVFYSFYSAYVNTSRSAAILSLVVLPYTLSIKFKYPRYVLFPLFGVVLIFSRFVFDFFETFQIKTVQEDSYRLAKNIESMRLIMENPILGARNVDDVISSKFVTVQNAHNLFLEIAQIFGIVAAFFIVFFCLNSFRYILKINVFSQMARYANQDFSLIYAHFACLVWSVISSSVLRSLGFWFLFSCLIAFSHWKSLQRRGLESQNVNIHKALLSN